MGTDRLSVPVSTVVGADHGQIVHDLDAEGMRRAREAYVSKRLNIDIKKHVAN